MKTKTKSNKTKNTSKNLVQNLQNFVSRLQKEYNEYLESHQLAKRGRDLAVLTTAMVIAAYSVF
jgi:hypothetical protein